MFCLLERQDKNANNDVENIVILRHDFQNDKFTQMNSEMSVHRQGCAAVFMNNNNINKTITTNNNSHQQRSQVLVFGGCCTRNEDVVESCSNVLNHHQQHQQWRQIGRRMPMALAGFAAVNLSDNNGNDKVYLLGGYNHSRGGTQDRCYEYVVTTETYKNMPSMKSKRRFLTGASIKNKLLFAIGGSDENDDILNTVECFDTSISNNDSNAEWSILKAKMNKKRWACCSASVGDIIYVFGGLDENHKRLDSIEMYNTSKQNSNFVLLDAKMKTARNGASAVVLGYHIIIIGGRDKNYNELNSIDIFNTKTQEFVDSSKYAFPTMTVPRSFCAAVLVENNDDDNNNDTLGMVTKSKKIVVVGGRTRFGDEGSRTAELIDIKTTAIPISQFCFTKSSNDEYDDGKLPTDINKNILSFLISESETKNNSYS